jgi:energy-coupling factor transport system permease protein
VLSNITLGQYYPGNSALHKLDPRTKILLTTTFISSIFLAQSYLGYLVLTAFVVMTIAISRIPFKLILRSIKPLWIIVAFTLGIHMLTTPGTEMYAWGIISITKEGLRQGLMMSARLIYLIIISSLLTFTTSPIALTDGIEMLLRPLKKIGVPAHELAMMMTIALRFIPTLLEETERIIKAQSARGVDFQSGNILKRAKNMVPILVPLFISAFRRADELATAMEARCYRGGENRTRMKQLAVTSRDYLAGGVLVVLLIILIALRFYGG